ncbi:MAG: DUF6150 family protein [Reichenbachiella sp.]
MLSFILSSLLLFSNAEAAQNDPCAIFGKMYFEKDPYKADYRVYIEDSETFSDVIVFQEQNGLYADRAGHWFTVDNPGLANAWIYIEKDRNLADFTIYYTDYESFAGCNR